MKFAAAFFALLFAAAAQAQDWDYSTVTAADGVPLVVAETGNPDGPAVLFIHGYSQSLSSWKAQLNDPLLQAAYRLVAVDLRGHSASGKPWAVDAYEPQDWGDDIATVIAEKNLNKPVLIGWSFGGTVMISYVRHHGTDDISGLIFAGGAMSFEPRADAPAFDDMDDLPPEVAELRRGMMQMASPDIALNLAGTKLFVGQLAAVPLPDDTMDEALAYNMMLPAYVRDAMGKNQTDFTDLAGNVKSPALLIHGAADALVPVSLAETNVGYLPNSELIVYDGIGHAPFLEDPARFNADVMAFAERVFAR
jgi:non-heme chloroperoxidase